MRGGLSPEALIAAATESPDLLFLVNQKIAHPPENLHPIHPGPELDFSDILASCDIALSKVGYGILSDCIATQTALLYPPRTGFREDEISRQVCPQYMRMQELSSKHLASGHWRTELTSLLNQPQPPFHMPHNGDQVIARLLCEHL
jgi:L-arabinokinase